MRVIEKVEIKLEWKDIDSRVVHPRPTYKRSTGKKVKHVMEILRHVAVNNGRLRDEDRIDEMPLVVGLGMAFEEWCAGLYPNMHLQPGEVKREGVAGNPDGFDSIFIGDLVDEFKFTYKSLRKRQDIRDEWMWMQQVMAYINIIDQEKYVFGGEVFRPSHGRFHICWANGDYTYPLQPRYIRYLVEFGRMELEENWNMMTKYAKEV